MAGQLIIDQSPEDYVNSAMNMPVSTESRMASAAEAGFAAPFVGAQELESYAGILPKSEGEEASSFLDTLNNNAEVGASGGQKVGNWVAGMAGGLLNPISIAAGGVGGLAARAAFGAASEFAPTFIAGAATAHFPELLGQEIPSLTASKAVTQLAEHSSIGFGVFAGQTIPSSIADNYDANTNNIHWGGVATDALLQGGIGAALPVLGFLRGTIFGKIKDADIAANPESVGNSDLNIPTDDKDVMSALQTAVDNKTITPEEFKWYQDTMTDPGNKDLIPQAAAILKDQGHDVDMATNKVNLPLVSEDAVKNLQVGSSDALTSDIPDNMKENFTNYVMNNEVDQLRNMIQQKPSIADGVKGYIDSINKKLVTKDESLANADDITNKYLKAHVKSDEPFSQKSMYRMLKKDPSARLQLTVPEAVETRLKQDAKLSILKKQLSNYEKILAKGENPRISDAHAKVTDKINALQENLEKIRNPREEVQELEQKLLPEGELAKEPSLRREYQRVLDLAPHSDAARGLLYRIHVRDEFNKQEALKNSLDTLMKAVETPTDNLAKLQDVKSYLKAKIESKLPKTTSLPEILANNEKAKNINYDPSNAESELNDHRDTVMKYGTDELKKEFSDNEAKMNAFKDSSGTLEKLLACVKGAIGG